MLTDSIPFLLADCSRQVRYAFDAKARSVGVTRPQYRVLLSLARYGGATQSELAEMLDVERITLGRMIDRMADAGLVERRADPADRRVWRLHTLPAGEALVERLAAIAEEVDAEALSHLAPEARDALKDHLVTMRDGNARPARKGSGMNDMSKIEGDADVEAAPRRPWWRLPLMLVVPVIVVLIGAWLWVTSGHSVSTDNAQVDAHVVAVAPEVGGRIVAVNVVENQAVKAGDILYRIDPEPYRIALMQANAAVGQARLEVAQLQGGYQSKVADIGSKASDVSLAEQNFGRQATLLRQGFTTRANYDAAKAALDAARAQRSVANADAAAARAMIADPATGGHPQVEAAIAMRDKAALDLARTVIRAPMAGTISQSDKLEPGTLAVQMLSNVSVVSSDYWIDANFKETQLSRIRIGQAATVKLDAVPDKTFRAHVIGIGSGTGSQFSLLPAQNATGNWVKVTQRVPVRIKLDETSERPLVAGWSAHVTVKLD